MFSGKFSFAIVLLFLFLLNLILKLPYAAVRDIAMDEPFSIFHSQQSIGEIINFFNSADENNPPLYFIILHYWMKIFNDSVFSIRLLSVMFSSLTAVVLFGIGYKYFNSSTGIIAYLIFTFSTLHIYYSHEARTYSLFSLLTALSLLFYLGIIKNPENKINYLFIFLSNLILIYSHYFGFFILFTEVFSFSFVPNKKKIWKGLSILFLLTVICYLPHLFVMVHRLFLTKSSGIWVSSPAVTEYYGNLNRFLNNKYCMLLLILLLAVSFAVSIKKKKFRNEVENILKNPLVRIIFIWFFIPYTLMFLLSFKLPMFIDRYILYTTIPFYLFISLLFNFLIENKITRYVLSGIFILSLIFTVQLNPDNNRRLKEATGIVKGLKKQNTVVIVAPEYADLSFTYHYNINYFKDYKNLSRLLASENIFPVNSSEMTNNILKNYNSDCIYFQADSYYSDPDELILKSIEKKYSKHTKKSVFEIYTIHYFRN